MAEKRKRGQNFSLEDKDKLIKILLQHKDTVLNKRTDGTTNDAKNQAWIDITNSFNSSSNTYNNFRFKIKITNYINRYKESLMKMWEKSKSESKKYHSQMRNSTTQTGGGPLILKIYLVLEQVCSILGRGCTGILGVPDCDVQPETGPDLENVHIKVLCTQNDIWQTEEQPNVITMEEPTEALEEIQKLDNPQNLTQPIHKDGIEDTLADGRKADNTQELLSINRTPLWSRRRPLVSNYNERSEATFSVSCSIQNVYKRKETVEDLKEQLLREGLEFKKKLYELQLQAAVKEVEIKTEILNQIKDGGFSLNNLFGVQNQKKE